MPEPPEHVPVVAVAVPGDHVRPVQQVSGRQPIRPTVEQIGDFVDTIDEDEQPDSGELFLHRIQHGHGEPGELGDRPGDVAQQVKVGFGGLRIAEGRIEGYPTRRKRPPHGPSDVQSAMPPEPSTPGDPDRELVRKRADGLAHPSQLRW